MTGFFIGFFMNHKDLEKLLDYLMQYKNTDSQQTIALLLKAVGLIVVARQKTDPKIKDKLESELKTLLEFLNLN